MKTFTFATVVSAGLAAATLESAAPAAAAPAGVGTAQDVVNSVEAQGYTVLLKKVGSAPLGKCTVSAVQSAAMDDLSTNIAPHSVCVHVTC